MTCRKTLIKKFCKVYLSASGSQCIKIKIMNVDIPLLMSLWMLRSKNIHLIELLCTHRSVFKHCTHCGIAVYISILTLQIVIFRWLESKILINFHKTGIHFSCTSSVWAVEYITFCSISHALLDKYTLNAILNLFNSRHIKVFFHKFINNFTRKLQSFLIVILAHRLSRLVYSASYFLNIESYSTSVTLFYLDYHNTASDFPDLSLYFFIFSQLAPQITTYCIKSSA